ncbi:MAG: cyclic beta 1-2 glucan synthetase, partial [Betaproteobacteria bacterium]
MSELQLLSNGAYHVLVTASGHAHSRWHDMALTRWRADALLDDGGARCHVRDRSTEPSPPAEGGHDFQQGRATFQHRGRGIETRTEIAVARDDPVSLRRVVITNLCDTPRAASATSYAEIVLSPPATDSAHPAFSKLFVQTEIEPALQAILASRRPSTPDDPTPWLFHFALIGGSPAAVLSFETDRMRFIGRGRGAGDPQALDNDAALSGTAGAVLDAVAAIRVAFVLEPGASITIDWLTGAAASREACVALARKVRCDEAVRQILAQAGTYRRTVMHTLGAADADALLYQRMAALLVYGSAALRAEVGVIEQNRRGQSDLWRFGISGDLPIVLLRVAGPEFSAVTRQVVQAQAWWNAFGVRSELAVVCARSSDGEPSCFDRVRREIDAGPGANRAGQPGGIFVLDGNAMDDADGGLLASVASIVLSDGDTLAAQVARRLVHVKAGPADAPLTTCNAELVNRVPSATPVAANGFGAFTPDGREYVVTTSAAHMTPAPWVNVIANPEFGTLVSESGSATTWSENAQQFRLTPWSNDPVSDPNTEA